MEGSLAVQLAVAIAKCAFSVAFVMNIVPILIWGERKVSSFIQDRPGPNRAHIMGIRAVGLVHTLNDVVKLIMKEDIVPDHVEKRFWFVAPVIAMSVSLCTFAVIPFGDHLTLPFDWVNAVFGPFGAAKLDHDVVIPLQVAGINGGMLYILAITSLGVYGIMLAGWASNNKFSLLGGLRSSAQLVSYELAMGLSVAVMFMLYGSPRLDEIVLAQQGSILNWGVFRGAGVVGILAFVLFWTSVFAETNRLPFDMPEGEAELVAGYHLEYSSLRFALFFMAEYANMIVGSAVTATLFFGGYTIPFLTGEQIREHADTIIMAIGIGGALTFPIFAVLAWNRRKIPFYDAVRKLDPKDARLKEPAFWVVAWLGAAAAHVGLAVLGSQGLVSSVAIGPELVALLLQISALGAKVLIGTFFMIWVRWTLPRFRYDQVMSLGWRYMLPLALFNVLAAGVWIAVFPG